MAVIKERKDECQFVMCCFQSLQRPAAKNCQGRELKLAICMCMASAIFARRKQSHMRKDSKGEIHKGTGFIAMATPPPWWRSEKQNILKKGRRKKINQCHVPRESRKRCSLRKRVDISTIWWTPPDINRGYNSCKLLGWNILYLLNYSACFETEFGMISEGCSQRLVSWEPHVEVRTLPLAFALMPFDIPLTILHLELF